MEEKLSTGELESQVLRQQVLEMTRKLSSAESEIQELTEKLKKAESEIQALRQQAATMTPIHAHPEDGHVQNVHLQATTIDEESPDDEPQRPLNEKQQDLLIMLISQNLGYSEEKPIAAYFINKCLLHWRSFEVENTSIFDRIIHTIGLAIEAEDITNDTLGYWLSNTSSLLLLLPPSLKVSGAAGVIPKRRRTTSPSLLDSLPSANDVQQTEAKYPALLFKQQLTAFLEKIYGMIRDNLKKEISPLLGSCIQAPRTSRIQAKSGAQQDLTAYWQSIVKSLNNYLRTMKANNVPPFLVGKIYFQVFNFVNVHLLNSLLLRRECCSFNNGEYVKAGLAELEKWCYDANNEYCGSAWDELTSIRQAVEFLVLPEKPLKTLIELTNDFCPALSISQLYRICTMYWDDKHGTLTVSPDIISDMRVEITKDNDTGVSQPFLLDADSSIPFSLDDIYSSMPLQGAGDIDPLELLREHLGLSFLTHHPE